MSKLEFIVQQLTATEQLFAAMTSASAKACMVKGCMLSITKLIEALPQVGVSEANALHQAVLGSGFAQSERDQLAETITSRMMASVTLFSLPSDFHTPPHSPEREPESNHFTRLIIFLSILPSALIPIRSRCCAIHACMYPTLL